MATVSDRQTEALAVRPWGKEATEGSKSEQYLARRFAAASSDFKGMALTTFLLAFAVAAVGWLLGGVLIEHWILPGGLPSWARWAWLGAAAAALVAATVKWLVPLLRYRVNLVYAARAIEREHPELHNDLVNAVLVKERSGEAAEAVVKSLRRRAARRLSRVPDEGVVDRQPAVRLAWALSGLVCLACLYQVFAPKSLVVSAARLVAPWSRFAPPSRVRIEPPQLAWRLVGEDSAAVGDAARRIVVAGGVAELVRGRQLVLATEIDGLAADERPELVVTPLREDGWPDGAAAAWRMPLKGAGGNRRTVVVPGDGRGLDQPVELVVTAGDARSERIRVVLLDAPAVLVREIRYEYPAYMGRDAETLLGQGDIRGVEGTKVTIVAVSNRPLAAVAIDLGCDGRRDVSLSLERPDAKVGSGSFTLRLNADRSQAEFASYRFVYRPRAGSAGRDEPEVAGQLEHRIEVIPDLAPEVAIEAPEEKVLRVPPDAPVTVRVRAVDPDFGLASVRVETRLAGGGVRPGEELLVGGPRKSLRVAETLVPSTLGAGPGSRLEYRAVAIDTRPEKPNEVATEWQALQIDASAPPQGPPPPQGEGEGEQPEGDQKQPGDGGPDAGGDKQEGKPNDSGENRPGQDGRQDGEQSKQGGEAGQGGDQKQQGDTPGEQKGDQKGQDGQQADGAQGQEPSQQGKGNDQKSGEGADPNGKQPGQGSGKQGDNREGEGQKGRGRQQGQADGEAKEPGQQGGDQGAGQPGKQPDGRAGGEEAGQQQGQPNPAVASDGTDDGEAIERILENRRRNADRNSAEQRSEPGRQGQGGEQQGGEQQGGEQQGGEQQGGEQQGGEQQQPAGQKDPSDGSQCKNADGEPCGKPGCSSCNGGSQPGSGGGSSSGQGQQGQGQQGEGQQGEGQQGEGQQGEAQQGEGQPAGGGQAGRGGSAGGPEGQGGGGDADNGRREMEWGRQNLEHARNAADLAVEHLRNALDQGRRDVLDDLGWTPEQARAFLDRWRAMQRLAGSDDPAERAEFERAVRSLGLRPDGVRSSRDVPTDVKGGQAEGRRSRPPGDYREQFKAFMQGTSSR